MDDAKEGIGKEKTQAEGSIRLDLFLKISRLIPRRAMAQEVCQGGSILVNGRIAKGARLVRVGDLIEWRQKHKVIIVKIANIPAARPGKKEATTLFELIARRETQESFQGFFMEPFLTFFP